jgi:soluble lytic murein transglycosylase-like protein
MQLMPQTAKHYGVEDRTDPMANLHGGARYLRHLLQRYKSDTPLALAAYNAGEGAVDKYGGTIPPYGETQDYVVKVMFLRQQYLSSFN